MIRVWAIGQGLHGVGRLATGGGPCRTRHENGKVIELKRGDVMRKMIAVAAALTLALSLPASALECLVPSIQRDYWGHKERPETYVLALGGFSDLKLSREGNLGDIDMAPALDFEVWTARFTGFRASRRAFDKPFETEVTLVFPDYSVIGGGYDSSGEVERLPGKTGLVWLMQMPDGYRAVSYLCGEVIDTDPANVKPALRCLRGGYCPNPD
jgi:hypothetical protein